MSSNLPAQQFGFNNVRDGDVGQDRTPSGVRSPVAHQVINVSSVAVVGNTIHESINDVLDGDVGQD